MYIDAKKFADWLLDKHGSGRGTEAHIVFDILEYIANTEKTEIKEETNNG